jgi:hypothetical protein
MQWLVEQPGQAKVTYAYFAGGSDHNVCRFQVSVEDPVTMEILTAIQKLEHDALDRRRRYRVACRLGMMVYDLQKIMLGIFKDHENTLVLQNDFDKPDNVDMAQLGTKGHFPDGGLGDTRILDLLAFFVRFKFLDGELSGLAMTTNSLVNSSVSPAADETDHFIAVNNADFTLVANMPGASIRRI